VSKATLYRHVELLADGGILDVAEERRVRGAVERHYRLDAERARIDPETAATLTPDDHRRGFGIALAALLAEFNAYLDQDDANPAADPVGYRQHAIWLDHTELEALVTELRAAILPRLANSPTPGTDPLPAQPDPVPRRRTRVRLTYPAPRPVSARQ
jgi:hypothetical protein